MALCDFKQQDGTTWNMVELDAAGNIIPANGPDELGRVRVQCRNCGRLYPARKDPPRKINNPRGLNCNGARRAARLAAAALQKPIKEKRAPQAKSCPESCLLRAKAHQAGLIAELNSVILKSKDHELKAIATQMMVTATAGKIDEPLFKTALELAVKQALREGEEHAAKADHLGEPGAVG